ncbi:hypothetical protein ECC02_005986 [Trypanosoma cruzi]|uniref:Uncharacterized protein n=1 Tax=Trypanosoma cruzi TaxID=5693 RepID=A0A7J6Y2P9_TRYCR|nr:hypothetical protein ECC02_005986 [Trypanosoma cruzi]
MGCSNSKNQKEREDKVDPHERILEREGNSASCGSRSATDVPERTRKPGSPSKKESKGKKKKKKEGVERGKDVTVEPSGTGILSETPETALRARPLHAVEASGMKTSLASSLARGLQAIEIRETRVIHPPHPNRAGADGVDNYAVSSSSDMLASVITTSPLELEPHSSRPTAGTQRRVDASPEAAGELPLSIQRSLTFDQHAQENGRRKRRMYPHALDDESPLRNSRGRGAAVSTPVTTSSMTTTTSTTRSSTPTSWVGKGKALHKTEIVEPVGAVVLPPMAPPIRAAREERPTEATIASKARPTPIVGTNGVLRRGLYDLPDESGSGDGEERRRAVMYGPTVPNGEHPWTFNSAGWEVLEQIHRLLKERSLRASQVYVSGLEANHYE